jgi:ubiquinone biosynthesis monooxygenase Coq7
MSRNLTGEDQLVSKLDSILRAVTRTGLRKNRESPAFQLPKDELSNDKKLTAGRIMRVNHCGEVCAQALYLGQSLTSRDKRVSHAMNTAASEEADHLAWCDSRLTELGTRPSYLNPLFFGMSMTAGMASGLMGNRFNLGFVAATEEQVVKHLDEHIDKLPQDDHRSRAVLVQMREDEDTHRTSALNRGGMKFPQPMKNLMTHLSKLMTRSTFWV